MENPMFDFSTKVLTQDQMLVLQSKILDFVREALVYDKGYVVFEITNLGVFEFNIYYSDGSKIDAQYEETRTETIDRILYTIDCKELSKYKNDTMIINDIIRYLYNYVVGMISSNILEETHHIKNFSFIFKK